ncbi:MAG: UdgX family uracil-DNA binding protein [Phreatobacter sp.]|uniref:UdgX family uracil-DNA binding protein n=1 Tax=Phreatobacter sp. TaxID=1966341 RepID=UPI00403576DE
MLATASSIVQIRLRPGADLDGFRAAARSLIAAGTPPEAVVWTQGGATDLFGAPVLPAGEPLSLPRAAADLVQLVVCHRDPERYGLLYRLIWRLTHGEKALLEVMSDPLVHRLAMMGKAIRRDLHKMHAFLRFRRVETVGGERFVAWFEPDHHVLAAAAPFFRNRFGSLDWTILTPEGRVSWTGGALVFGPPATRDEAAAGDGFEEGWRDYYESTFNPARLNTTAMRAEMPKKYWRNMPETAAIPAMVRAAVSRVDGMMDREPVMASKRNPDKAVAAMLDAGPHSLEELNRIIAGSEPLVPGATRAVLGEGPIGAAIAFVGEQPGDQEDLQGRPFVGPAGQLLDRALAEAGIERSGAYLTNAVKHFKFVQRGKRRIHESPTAGEVKHYRWWLERELDLVRPGLVVALGATAALALAGKAVPVGRNRGPFRFGDRPGFLTVHPSSLLREPDPAAREAAFRAYCDDFRRICDLAAA